MQGADGTPVWLGVKTALPNRLVRATIEAGCLEPWLGPVAAIRAEVPYGENRRSRIDLLLTPAEGAADPRPIYVEVKNTTWSDGDLALFPDTVTERGQKHLVELTALVPGARAVLVPCLSRGDVTRFAPGDSADPRYGLTPGTAGFCNALDDLLGHAQWWLHGHLHCPQDYTHNGCRVVANTLGYVAKGEQASFSEVYAIDLATGRIAR